MLIGVFSKMGASGGSEHRCVEMANAAIRAGHECYLLAEKNINSRILSLCNPGIRIYENTLCEQATNLHRLYEVNSLLIINSDSYSFSKSDYWEGKTDRHSQVVDISQIPQMVFVYNFVISPAANLWQLSKCPDIRIICANQLFYNEISNNPKYNKVRHFPRIRLESPINQEDINYGKRPSDKIRIGRHSKAHSYKFNSETKYLIQEINRKFGNRIIWDFMGVDSNRANELVGIPNVHIRSEYSIDVCDYLNEIDIFLFFITWDRNEPWSRAVAEALMSGCPVLATNKAGNQDQIIHGNNGFLCNNLADFEKYLILLIENPDLMRLMGRNGHIYSAQYTSQKVFTKFNDFITNGTH